MINPETQLFQAKRMGAHVRSVRADLGAQDARQHEEQNNDGIVYSTPASETSGG
jgi:hypothetical protein